MFCFFYNKEQKCIDKIKIYNSQNKAKTKQNFIIPIIQQRRGQNKVKMCFKKTGKAPLKSSSQLPLRVDAVDRSTPSPRLPLAHVTKALSDKGFILSGISYGL